jgi:hypothetical protein
VITSNVLPHAYYRKKRFGATATRKYSLTRYKISGDGLSVTAFTHFIKKANACQRNNAEHNNKEVFIRLSGEIKTYFWRTLYRTSKMRKKQGSLVEFSVKYV